MTISLLAAFSRNLVIGQDNKIPWKSSEDLKRFKQITTEDQTKKNVVVMGRKTYESMGKPLPNRVNRIVSSSVIQPVEGVEVYKSLNDAMLNADNNNIFIIGGSIIYKHAYPKIDKMYLTLVDLQINGENRVKLPIFNPKNWIVSKMIKSISNVSYGPLNNFVADSVYFELLRVDTKNEYATTDLEFYSFIGKIYELVF